MKIILAKTAGFCMGVRRAVEMALDAPDKHINPIFTFGPLIHNKHVLNLLREKGISVLNDIPDPGSGTVLIRAHGVPPEIGQKLKKAGYTVLDATCPRVIKVQSIIKQHAAQGYTSIIIGDKDHPEVIGLLGFTEEKGYVVGSIKDFDALPEFNKAIIVAQTTQNTLFFEKIKKMASQKFPHYKIFNTICDSTERRQAEVNRLAELVDVIIVVGGRNSGNTQRLTNMARQAGKQTFQIESESELDIKALEGARRIGVTAGASTPNWILRRVYRTLESLPFNRRQTWRRAFFAMQRTLLLTNIYVSIGAGCLCYACLKLLGIYNFFPYMLISILYVLSMHTLNHLTGRIENSYNDPYRAVFYEKYYNFLTFLALSAGGAGLITAYTMGLIPFLILLAMSGMGLSYNFKLVPDRFTSVKYHRIKDVPGSKTALIALAWGVVSSVFPYLSVFGKFDIKVALVFIWATGMVFVRTAFFDILDMQGDRLVGKETIPLLLGEKRSFRILKGILIGLIAIFFFSSLFQFITNLAIALIICPVFILMILSIHKRGSILPGINLEFLVETLFILAGAIALLWAILIVS